MNNEQRPISQEAMQQSRKTELPIQKTSKAKEIVNFLRVSPFHQIQTVAPLLVAGFLTKVGIDLAFSEQDIPKELVGVVLLETALAGFNETLAIRKFREYRALKGALTRRGWNERLIEPKTHSWCQRRATKVAASETGYKKEIKEYYADKGYRWYHLLPDRKK